jgi:hypothetical protein
MHQISIIPPPQQKQARLMQVTSVIYGLTIVFISGDLSPVPVFDFSFVES